MFQGGTLKHMERVERMNGFTKLYNSCKTKQVRIASYKAIRQSQNRSYFYEEEFCFRSSHCVTSDGVYRLGTKSTG